MKAKKVETKIQSGSSEKPRKTRFDLRPSVLMRNNNFYSVATNNNGYNNFDVTLYSFNKLPIKNKLRLGNQNDKYEQEADRVADQVLRMSICKQSEAELDNNIDQTRRIYFKAVPSKKQPTNKDLIQNEPSNDKTVKVSTFLERQISPIEKGKPLTNSERNYFEPRFGMDFSNVRIHNSPRTARIAEMMNARAFTIRQNISFGMNMYKPNTEIGKKLLAHELTHVIQQTGKFSSEAAKSTGKQKNIQEFFFNNIAGSATPDVQAYGRDVHFDWTKRWAEIYFGRDAPEALRIAVADQRLDEGWTHPTWTSLEAFNNQFMSDANLVHFPSRPLAVRELDESIIYNDFYLFGRALHRFQDSFSHSFPMAPGTGYNLDSRADPHSLFEQDVATILGPFQHRYRNTNYGRGAVIRHVVLGHYPDNFHVYDEQRRRDDEMQTQSIRKIGEFYNIFRLLNPRDLPVYSPYGMAPSVRYRQPPPSSSEY